MNEKMRSSVMGLLLGQFSSPLPISQKEPVAYLYNGVRLPALPEWDREAYPYAHISKFSDSTPTILYISNSFEFKNGSVGWAGTGWIIELRNSFANHAELVDGAWEPFSEISGMRNGSYVFSVIWSNFDVLNEDGSVYLAATDPVPVYE